MGELNVDRYIQAPKHPCPQCGSESKPHTEPNTMICTNHVKTGGPRHTWTITPVE